MQYRRREQKELKPSGVEWLGDISKDWDNGKLKYFMKLVSGELTQKTDNGKYFLYGANVIIGVTNNFNINEKSIIIGRVGSSGYINIAEKESWISDNALIVKIKKENIFNYIYYILKFMDLNRFSSFNAQPLISATTINNLSIYIPNSVEQQKIANFLYKKTKAYDEIILNKESLIKKLEDAKESLISEVVTGKLKIAEKSTIWKVKKLAYVFNFKNGVNADASSYGKGLKFINVKETIYTNSILEKDIESSVSVSVNQIKENLLKKGDVLFNRTSETIEELALSTVYYDDKDALFGGFVIRGIIMSKITVLENEITILKIKDEDYISLTDMIKSKDGEFVIITSQAGLNNIFKIIISCFLFVVFLFANDSCIKCHQKESKKCKTSNHTTLKNAINITREVWGIKNSDVTLQTIPYSPLKIEKPADLVDDFLRRKCLKCHLGVKNSGELGMKRKKSCLACHEKHNTTENCQTQKISTDKCLTCHNKQFVGTDYLGLFPKDHHHSFRAPLTKEGKYPSQKYGIDHHNLNEDIHHTLKMSCVDCHNNKDGKNWETGTKCVDCHKDLTSQNHTSYHSNISCSACHSSWNISSYELSVFRDDTADYDKWKDLTLQEDGYLTKFLNKALKSKKELNPMMPDWVDMKIKKGIWYSGWRYKRWEHFVLGNSDDGTIKILRPMFQFRISYRDKNGTMILDDVSKINNKNIEAWIPYSPHTVIKKAKSCESCHENKLQDIKLINNTIVDLKKPINIINGSILTKKQLNKLNSKKYKNIRSKLLFK